MSRYPYCEEAWHPNGRCLQRSRQGLHACRPRSGIFVAYTHRAIGRRGILHWSWSFFGELCACSPSSPKNAADNGSVASNGQDYRGLPQEWCRGMFLLLDVSSSAVLM
jgi:hypothetical protein